MSYTVTSNKQGEPHNYAIIGWATLAVTALVTWLIYAKLPIIGDAWAPVIFGQEQGGGLSRVLKGYFNGYNNGNPRIGQFWLIFYGQFPRLHATIFAFAVPSLIVLMGCHLVGHNYRANFGRVVGLGFIALALMWFMNREIGATMFYQATSGNYLFAVLLLLGFLLPYRRAVSQAQTDGATTQVNKPFLRHMWLGLWLIVGFLAGLGHETYGPTVIVGLLVLFGTARFLDFRFKAWMGLGWLSFTLGYAALFLAPGQDKRYTESRLDGISVDASVLIDRGVNLVAMFLGTGVLLLCAAIVIAAYRYFTKRLSGVQLLVFTGFALLGLGMSLTGIGAPGEVIGERFVFAGHACLAIALCGWVFGGQASWRWLAPGLAVAGVYLGVEYTNTRTAYAEYYRQFEAQREAIKTAKTAGMTEAEVPAYTLPFYRLKKYVFKEFPQTGPNPRVNAFIARYYGLDVITVIPSEATRAFGKQMIDRPLQLTFANCPSDDLKSWTGKTDPLGIFICEDDYLVYYDSAEGVWVLSGFAEQVGFEPSRRFAVKRVGNDHPDTGQIILWGGRFTFSPSGAITTLKGDLHGVLKESAVIAAFDAGPVKLSFDTCPAADGRADKYDWQGAEDPLGPFICGETYEVAWDMQTLEWVITGLFESTRGAPLIQTRNIIGQTPYQGRINMLGGLYTFSAEGKVMTVAGERVGQIVLPPVSKRESQ